MEGERGEGGRVGEGRERGGREEWRERGGRKRGREGEGGMEGEWERGGEWEREDGREGGWEREWEREEVEGSKKSYLHLSKHDHVTFPPLTSNHVQNPGSTIYLVCQAFLSHFRFFDMKHPDHYKVYNL